MVTEGNREQVQRRAEGPGSLTCKLLHRGRRTAHAHKGCLGTWEVCGLPVKTGTWKRSEKPSNQGARRSRSAVVGARKSGNQSEGPGRAIGGTGVGTAAR